ncbi:hypothetical protein [Paenibacillus ehimensis]|uniref:hypothetical protein n=1 Tax=Paenibacillus ehimensis TaxID=79264 RepID=UPI00046F0C78|nr:hypothetical protein [Paenibacillus ehimensis]
MSEALPVIWNVDELLEEIRTVAFNMRQTGLKKFTASDLARWKDFKINKALDFQGQNQAINDTTIVNTIRHIINAFEIFQDRYVLDF